jgi:hypothetical protein
MTGKGGQTGEAQVSRYMPFLSSNPLPGKNTIPHPKTMDIIPITINDPSLVNSCLSRNDATIEDTPFTMPKIPILKTYAKRKSEANFKKELH